MLEIQETTEAAQNFLDTQVSDEANVHKAES